jgi:hypothetical protein
MSRRARQEISELRLDERREQMQIPHPEKRVRDDRLAPFGDHVEDWSLLEILEALTGARGSGHSATKRESE